MSEKFEAAWNSPPSLKMWVIGYMIYSTLHSELIAAFVVGLMSN